MGSKGRYGQDIMAWNEIPEDLKAKQMCQTGSCRFVAWGGIEDFKPRRDLLKWCCEDKSCFSDIETARKLKPNRQTRKKKKPLDFCLLFLGKRNQHYGIRWCGPVGRQGLTVVKF
jgi:hypothetical protein